MTSDGRTPPDTAVAVTEPDKRRRLDPLDPRDPRSSGIAAAAVIAASGVYLFWLARPLWFVLDDWAFLLLRRVTFNGDLSLLQPHNDHWVMTPVLIYRALYGVVGMHSYLPYVGLNIVLHLGVCAVLAVLLRRTGANPWVCVLALVPAAFNGPGGQDILWAFQMVFLGPCLLALLSILVIDRDDPLPRVPLLVWGMLTLSLTFSGAGVSAVAWVTAYTLLRRGLRPAILVGSVPAVVFLLWYVGFDRGKEVAPPVPPEWILPFVLRGTTNIWDRMLHVPWSGTVVLVVIVATTIFYRAHPQLRVLAGASLIGLFVNFGLLAVTRGGLGLTSALATRYLYTGVLLTIPALALTFQLAYDGLRSIGVARAARIVVWAVVGVGLLTCGVLGLHRSAMIQETRTGDLRDRVVAAAEMVRRGDNLLTDQVSPLNAPDIHAPLLASPEVQRRLPHEAPTADGALDAASTLKVAVAGSSFGLRPPREFPLLGRTVQPRDAGPGCRVFRAAPRATLVIPRNRSGAQIELIVSKNVVITRLSTQRYTTAGTAHGVTPGERFYVGSTSFEGDLVVVLPSGSVTLCTGGSAGNGG